MILNCDPDLFSTTPAFCQLSFESDMTTFSAILHCITQQIQNALLDRSCMNIYLRKVLRNFIETDNTLARSRRNQLPPQASSLSEIFRRRSVDGSRCRRDAG